MLKCDEHIWVDRVYIPRNTAENVDGGTAGTNGDVQVADDDAEKSKEETERTLGIDGLGVLHVLAALSPRRAAAGSASGNGES